MEGGWWIAVVIITLVIFLIAFAILLFYSPNYNRPKRNGPRQKHVPNYIVGLRSQVGSDVLPAIPILTTSTDIVLNQPTCDVGFTKIAKSGVYDVSYSVIVNFQSQASVSAAVRRRSCDGMSSFEILTASVEQITFAGLTSANLKGRFLAQLNAGDQVKITTVASSADAVYVPASDSFFLQSPTALASLQLTLQSQH